MYHYGNLSSMSRQMFRRYLVYYLTATTILTCGSSRRTPRRAFCSSCGRDNPEALASPWYPRRELNLQDEILQDHSVTPLQNSPYFRLAQREVSQKIARDNILSNQNPISPREYRSFLQQKPASGYLHANRLPSTQFVDKSKQQNSFLGDFPNKFAETLDKKTTLSLSKPVNNYAFAHDSPSRQFFSEPDRESFFFRNPRNKFSISSSENVEDHIDKEDPARKFNVVYNADKKPSWKDSRYISSDEIVPRKFFPIFRQTNILDEDKDEEEERNAIEISPDSIDQQYNHASAQDRYYSVGFDMPEVQREPHVLSQDLDTQEPTKNDEVFDNWDSMKDSLEISSLEQLKSLPSISSSKNFFETYSAEEDKIVTNKDGNEQINYPYTSLQDSYTWRPVKDETDFYENWDSAADNDLQDFIEINQLQETENSLSQVYPAMETNVRYFDNEEDIEKESQTETPIYNPFPSNMNTWRTTQDKKLPGKLDFMIHRGLQGIQKTGQPEIYPVEENNSDKYFQDKDKYTIQDGTRIDADKIIRAPVIDVTPYIFPQSILDILNALKYPTDHGPLIADLPETKNNILRANPTGKRHERLFNSGRVVLDDERNQDQIFVKDTNDEKKYNSFALDRKPYTKNNTQNEILAELDPDLVDEIESPPAKPTESRPTESFEKSSSEEEFLIIRE